MEKFYRVIAFGKVPQENDRVPPPSDPVAYYEEKETAFRCVEENWCDICEACSYPAAMVIETPFGCYPYCENRWYFEWEGDWPSGKYVQKEEPKSLEHWGL